MFKTYSYSDFITFRATPSPLSTMKKASFELHGWATKGTYHQCSGTISGESLLAATVGPSGQSL